MIGYEMGFSPARVYTTTKTSSVENFKHVWKNDMAVNMTRLFVGGVSRGYVSWATSNP